MSATRLSALIASYASARFARVCAASLREEWSRAGRAAADLEVVVVDDASPTGEQHALTELEADGARVLRSEHNRGYGASIRSALAASSGAREDVVAVLNADVRFLPGSIEALLAQLARRPDAGAVAPRAFADPAATLLLPHHALPSPREQLAAHLAARSPALARRAARRRARAALRAWTAEQPFEPAMLSGACLLLRRDWLERVETLFDPRYEMYFEDTDLCRRLRVRGARLFEVPGARIVHHWARSTGIGEDFERRVGARFRSSRRAYLERWHGRAARLAVELAERLAARLRAPRAPRDCTDLGILDAAPELRLARGGPFLIELGMTPNLWLAAGALGKGASWRVSGSAWEWMFAGRYFVRARSREDLAPLGAWTFEKRGPARDDPTAAAPDPERDRELARA